MRGKPFQRYHHCSLKNPNSISLFFLAMQWNLEKEVAYQMNEQDIVYSKGEIFWLGTNLKIS